MRTLKLECGGLSEEIQESELTAKLRECANDPQMLHCGGIISRPEYSVMSVYEWNPRKEKVFVARIYGTSDQLNKVRL